MVSDTLQLVFHKNLHINLHYSISKERNLDLIRAFGNFTGIDVIVYNADTTYVDFDGVVVLNNFEQSQIKLYEEQLQARKVMDILNNKGEKVYKTSTVGWSIAPSGSYAQGWRQPHPELDQFTKKGKLNKEGFNIGFPSDLKQSMGKGLLISSVILKKLARDKILLFPDKERNNEFSRELSEILGLREDISFEGGTIQCYFNDFNMHFDTENCNKQGYQYSSVLSTKINGIRVSWIGYTRKRAGNYMERKRKALCKKQNHLFND